MSDPADRLARPFTSFAFSVAIKLPNRPDPLCGAAFAECDGLETTMDVKTIREGGNNGAQIRFAGPLSFGTLTLKRGMTESFDLWDWMRSVRDDPAIRATITVRLLGPIAAADGSRDERARFVLGRCLPVKLKAPPLNAKDGLIAIEELQVAYETLDFMPRAASSVAAGLRVNISAG